tara:strand:- start:200 stop:304 length:105 start_codon:yes stop_codon:yes gene_type:complete
VNFTAAAIAEGFGHIVRALLLLRARLGLGLRPTL